MNSVIEKLASSDVEQLKRLWCQLYSHHARMAPHLADVGAIHTADESWRLRRDQYLAWQEEPFSAVLVARGEDRLVGYAMVRVVYAPGSWQWGDHVGVLETLVVDDQVRGAGIGYALLESVRRHLAVLRIKVMRISVIAGNHDAVRFYQREGALELTQNLILPV